MHKELIEKFNFGFYSEETFKLTFKRNKTKIDDLIDYYKSWDTILEIIKSTYKADSAFFILNIETTANIEGSIFMAMNGYYRQATSLLRCWFENGIYSIYFQDHPVEFEKWQIGELTHKQMVLLKVGELVKYLFQFPKFELFNEEYKKNQKKGVSCFSFPSFKEWINKTYYELSAYVHGRGYHRSSLAGITFKEEKEYYYNKGNFTYYVDLFNNILQILIISYLLYRPNFMNHFRKKRKLVLEAIREEYIDILKDNFQVKY